MDFIHKLISILLPPLAILLLLLFLPPYLVFKYISYIIRSFCSENVAGKVVLITGASSGIGEHLAYEYAGRGARLALVARREDRLCEVADKSRRLGSPDVIVIPADVSKMEDCKGFIDKAVDYFGRLDHLAAKAALISFYETLRVEFGSDIGITIVTPGLIKTDMVLGEAFTSEIQMGFLPGESAQGCAKAIVASACRRDSYLTEPSWYRLTLLLKMLCPELLDWICRLTLVGRPRSSKKTS